MACVTEQGLVHYSLVNITQFVTSTLQLLVISAKLAPVGLHPESQLSQMKSIYILDQLSL